MKRSIRGGACLLVAVLLGGAAALPAQSLVGSWQNQQFGVTMNLMPDGTYAFGGPQGQSYGRWAQQGAQFALLEATGRSLPYRILQLTATDLQLVDPGGVQIAFRRPAPPAAPKAGPPGEGDRVLSRKGGQALLARHVQAATGLAEFLIGAPLPPAERKAIDAEALREFTASPAGFVQEMEGLGASMAQLHTLTDPARIGVARQQLTAAMWKAVRGLPVEKRPLLARIIFGHVKVLAFDEANGLVLMDRDLAAAVEYLLFAHQLYCQLTGQQLPVTPQQQELFRTGVVSQFLQMPLEQRQFLCSASIVWAMIQAAWPRLNEAQRGQVTGQFAARFPDPTAAPPPPPAGAAAPGGKSLAERQREFQAQQNLYTTMSNMSLQNHATMLNVIENIGGTGNYWEVK